MENKKQRDTSCNEIRLMPQQTWAVNRGLTYDVIYASGFHSNSVSIGNTHLKKSLNGKLATQVLSDSWLINLKHVDVDAHARHMVYSI